MVYCQALLSSLKAAGGQPTNLAKVFDIKQGERLGEKSLWDLISDIGRREADDKTEATDS